MAFPLRCGIASSTNKFLARSFAPFPLQSLSQVELQRLLSLFMPLLPGALSQRQSEDALRRAAVVWPVSLKKRFTFHFVFSLFFRKLGNQITPMKKTAAFRFWHFAILLFPFFSFVAPPFTEGTFGVGASDPSQIELQLKADHTFTYQDLSNARAPIRVSGTWHLRHSTLTLQATQKVRFHKVWTLSSDQQVVKGRKGWCWYRLCRK